MSYFIRILCGSSLPLRRADIVDFIKDGVYFDSPRFEPPRENASASESEWNKLEVHYDPRKRPIVFYRNVADELVSAEVAELLDELRNQDAPAAGRVGTRLGDAKQIIGIEIDRDGLIDDAWSMLDAIECFIAERLDGIIYAPDDGYFDKRLARLL